MCTRVCAWIDVCYCGGPVWAEPFISCGMSSRGRGPGVVWRGEGAVDAGHSSSHGLGWVGAGAAAGARELTGARRDAHGVHGKPVDGLSGSAVGGSGQPRGLPGSRRGCLVELVEVGLGAPAWANGPDPTGTARSGSGEVVSGGRVVPMQSSLRGGPRPGVTRRASPAPAGPSWSPCATS